VREDGVVGHQGGVGRHEVGVVVEVALEVTVVAEAQEGSALAVAAVVVEAEDSGEAVAVSEGHSTSWGSASKAHANECEKEKSFEGVQRTCEQEIDTVGVISKMVYVLRALISSSTPGSRLNRSCCVITV
jgi:hypothetical protein